MDILTLSQYVINQFSQQSPDGITPLKLQKLLYYIKVWTLVAREPFVNAEFEHWDYGPVNREIYNYYKKYGNQPIFPMEVAQVEIRENQKEIIDFIVENYMSLDAFKLSEMTHTEKPWKNTKQYEIIYDQLIYSYYIKQQFAKNFQPFDLSNNPFYPLDSYSFILDIHEKDAQEIIQYSNYKHYKNAISQAERDFNKQWSKFVLI